jgi:hypothetical protein
MTDERKDPTVKELLEHRERLDEVVDAATAAQLARWFAQPATEAPPPAPAEDDPQMIEARERRAKAIANVDPRFLDAVVARHEVPPGLVKFEQSLDVDVADISVFDAKMIERTWPEPREIEISEDLQDDLRDCTPQALLRDLHRVESYFDKQLELIDFASEARVSASDIVAELMRTSWAIAGFQRTAWEEGHVALDEMRATRKQRWDIMIDRGNLPNRKVTGA